MESRHRDNLEEMINLVRTHKINDKHQQEIDEKTRDQLLANEEYLMRAEDMEGLSEKAKAAEVLNAAIEAFRVGVPISSAYLFNAFRSTGVLKTSWSIMKNRKSLRDLLDSYQARDARGFIKRILGIGKSDFRSLGNQVLNLVDPHLVDMEAKEVIASDARLKAFKEIIKARNIKKN